MSAFPIPAILLTQEQLATIARHGESAYPDESCGFLLGYAEGGARRIVEVLPLQNSGDSNIRFRWYEISPLDYIRVEDEADARDLAILGVFHSHPDHPAEPSPRDLERAWPNWSYLITSVRGGRATDTRAWLQAEDRSHFAEQDIITSQEESQR